MYKILVITRYWASSGCSVHSIVVEFESEAAANIAWTKASKMKDTEVSKLY